MNAFSYKQRLLGRTFREPGDSASGGGSSETKSETKTETRDTKDADASPTAAQTSGQFSGLQSGGWSGNSWSNGSTQNTDNESPAETARLKAQNDGDPNASIASGNVPGVNTNASSSWQMPGWLKTTLGILGTVPNPLMPLARGLMTAESVRQLADGVVNGDAPDAIGKSAKGIIGGRLAAVLNGVAGQALGPVASNAMSTYGQMASLSNTLGDTNLPTSPGSYLVGKAMQGGSTDPDGTRYAANGDKLDPTPVGGWSSHGSQPVPAAAPIPVAVAQPAAPAITQEPANGIIGNYLDWFNQGRYGKHA